MNTYDTYEFLTHAVKLFHITQTCYYNMKSITAIVTTLNVHIISFLNNNELDNVA